MDNDDALPVITSRTGAVATITLNRPKTLNALTTQMKDELLAALRAVAADPAVRAVVLTGAGRGFCSGQDLTEHATADSPFDTVRDHYNPIVTLITQMPKPVVCAVNGIAVGAGAAISFACDFRLAAADSSFLMAFARVGLGADSGASWTLQRLVGLGRATALLMLAEPITAAHALEMGLVNGVVPDHELSAAAAELAGRLSVGPTFAYGIIKQGLNAAASSDLAAALELEYELQSKCGDTHDHVAAVEAFREKRQATFTGA